MSPADPARWAARWGCAGLWSPELAQKGTQAAFVLCPCCHVPGRGTGSLAAAVLCPLSSTGPAGRSCSSSAAAAALLLAQGTSWCHPAATGLALSARGLPHTPGLFETPIHQLKAARATRGCEKCSLCEGTRAAMPQHWNGVTARGGHTPAGLGWPWNLHSFSRALGLHHGTLWPPLVQGVAPGTPGTCLSSAVQPRVRGGGGGGGG